MTDRVIDPNEFIRMADDTLLLMGKPYDSPEALCLLVLTAWHESGGLRHVRQIRGPALTLYQIEPRTYQRYMVEPVRKRDPRMLGLLSLVAHAEWLAAGGCMPGQIDDAMDGASAATMTAEALLESLKNAPPIESLVLGDRNQLHRAATIAARLVYWEATSKPLPRPISKGFAEGRYPTTLDNHKLDTEAFVVDCARYWKRWYNTKHGKGRVEQFVHGAEEMRDLGVCPVTYVAENWRW